MSSLDDSISLQSYLHDGEEDQGHEDHLPRNMSRLSMCTNSSKQSLCEDGEDIGAFMSFPCNDYSGEYFASALSSDSDKEVSSYVSLPATPLRRKKTLDVGKEYASENEVGNVCKGGLSKPRRSLRRGKKYIVREKGLERAWEEKKKLREALDDDYEVEDEPERSIHLGLEEITACRDLGFQFGLPSSITRSCSTLDTASSGGNSPIANWRISSPGDDPKEVKARLKVWAQAVAMASTSRLFG